MINETLLLFSSTRRVASPARAQAAFPSASCFPLVCLLCSSSCLPVHLSVHFGCAEPIWKQLISQLLESGLHPLTPAGLRAPGELGVVSKLIPTSLSRDGGPMSHPLLDCRKNLCSEARDLGLVQRNCNKKNCALGQTKEPEFSWLHLVPAHPMQPHLNPFD